MNTTINSICKAGQTNLNYSLQKYLFKETHAKYCDSALMLCQKGSSRYNLETTIVFKYKHDIIYY